MLDELSNLESLNTSDNFLNKLHQKIDALPKVTSSQNIEKISFFNYNYMPIISIAAGVAIFIFSISIFMDSNHDGFTGSGTLSNSFPVVSNPTKVAINDADTTDTKEVPLLHTGYKKSKK